MLYPHPSRGYSLWDDWLAGACFLTPTFWMLTLSLSCVLFSCPTSTTCTWGRAVFHFTTYLGPKGTRLLISSWPLQKGRVCYALIKHPFHQPQPSQNPAAPGESGQVMPGEHLYTRKRQKHLQAQLPLPCFGTCIPHPAPVLMPSTILSTPNTWGKNTSSRAKPTLYSPAWKERRLTKVITTAACKFSVSPPSLDTAAAFFYPLLSRRPPDLAVLESWKPRVQILALTPSVFLGKSLRAKCSEQGATMHT